MKLTNAKGGRESECSASFSVLGYILDTYTVDLYPIVSNVLFGRLRTEIYCVKWVTLACVCRQCDLVSMDFLMKTLTYITIMQFVSSTKLLNIG